MTLLLVGIGYWGKNWAKTLDSIGALGGICDISLVPGQPLYEKVHAQFPNVTLFNRIEPALADSRFKGVVIATPVPTHFQMARHALLANKHVLVEKPLTMNVDEAEQLVSLAEERERTLAVGHVLMHHTGLLKLKEIVDSGELGEILSVTCTRANLGKIRNEENVWWSLAPHDISIVSMLLNEPMHLQTVDRQTLLGRNELEDMVRASFVTDSGKAVVIESNWMSPYKRHETVVMGTEKIAIFNDALPQQEKLKVMDYELLQVNHHVESINRGDEHAVDYATPNPPLTAQAKAFISAIETGKPLLNDGHNGLMVVQALMEVQAQLDALRQQPSQKNLAEAAKPAFVPFS